MQNDFNSYIDDFNKITILIPKNLCWREKQFFLHYDDTQILLDCKYVGDFYEQKKFLATTPFDLDLHKEYIIVDEYDNVSCCASGKVCRTEKFERLYSYDGPLGVEYSKNSTTFRLWTPVAKDVSLILISPKNISQVASMIYKGRGLWEAVLYGNFEQYKYYYRVKLVNNYVSVNDPYAISSSANGKYNYVIDKNKLSKMLFKKPPFSGNLTDAIIYEANVRDFSSDESSHAINKGKFLGMLENHPTELGYPTGVSYLGFLGVTHVQLMPVFDFGGVDDNSDEMYNWGYNPKQYFIPCGWFSNNPEDPYARLNEFRRLVDGMHANNLRVVLDMVFNHVYDMWSFPFEKLVPGYFYRVDANDMYTEVCGCQNDLETRRFMARRFVVDVIKYWTNTFCIDGIRFDLMGLLDIGTMKAVEHELHSIDPSFVLYGEGWHMPSAIPEHEKPHMYNASSIPEYGFFNDSFRDFFKGNQWDHSIGYAAGDNADLDALFYLVTGSCLDKYIFDNPTQSVNYVECHDNYTFVDFLKVNSGLSDEAIHDASRLALCLAIISEGVPFIHAGEEFFRSKKLTENSYNSGDSINALCFKERDKYIENILTIRDIIKVRKDYDEFRFKSRLQISNRFKVLPGKNPFTIKIEGKNYFLYLIIKNNYVESTVEYSNAILVFDGFNYVNEKVNGSISLTKPGIYIFKENKNE